MKAYAAAALFTMLSTGQGLESPEQKLVLDVPCRDARVVMVQAQAAGLVVAQDIEVPAGRLVVLQDAQSAMILLVYQGYACLLGAGDRTPLAPAPQRPLL